jgi:hypothetical protein
MKLRDKAEIVVACALLPPALEVLPAARVVAWLRRVRPRRREALSGERYAEAVDRVLNRAPSIWRNTCLRRAVVLEFLLRRSGREAEVVIGVRRAASGSIEAHAWIRCEGVEPYLDPEDLESFVRMTAPRNA